MALRAASLLAASVSLLLAAGGCETHKAGADNGAQAAADHTAAKPVEPAKGDEEPVANRKAPPPPPSEATPPAPPSEATPPTPPADDVAPAGGTDCAAVIDHVIALQLTQVPPEQRAQVNQVLPKIRAQGIVECDAKWNEAARKCLAAAKNPQELAPCQSLLAKGPNDAPPPPADPEPAPPVANDGPAPPAPPAPPADGGPDCSRVARNVTAILEKTFGDRAGKHDANVSAFEAECHGWSRQVRDCFLAARNIKQAKECSRVQRIDRLR